MGERGVCLLQLGRRGKERNMICDDDMYCVGG